MKPIELKIKGLNSFLETQTINFEYLTKDGLFGIVGPTGSGKTTVVDALTMALYGKMPRFEGSKRLSECVNSNTDEVYISFTFQIREGQKLKKYTAERKYKRKDEKINSKLARLVFFAENETKVLADSSDGVTNEIVNVTGLTYDDFTRSVVLPQGKFSQFLLLVGKDRRDMLERIFNYEKYGDILNKKISAELSEKRIEINKIASNIAVLGDVSEDTIKSETNKLKETENRLSELRGYEKETAAKLTNLAEIKNAVTEYIKYETEKNALINKQEAITNLKKLLDEVNRAVLVKAAFTEKTEAEKVYNENLAALKKHEKSFEQAKEKEENLKNEYDASLQKKETEYPHLLEWEARVKQAAIYNEEKTKLTGEISNASAELKKQNKKLDTLRQKLTAQEEAKLKAEEELKTVLKEKTGNTVTPEMRQVSFAGSVLQDKRTQIHSTFTQLKAKFAEIKKQGEANEAKLNLSLKDKNNSEQKIAEEKEVLARLKTELDKCIELKLNLPFAEAAKTLKDGEPCPVCGSVHHPQIAQSAFETGDFTEKIESLTKELSSKENNINAQNAKLQNISIELAILAERKEKFEAESEKSKEELTENHTLLLAAKQELELMQEKYNIADFKLYTKEIENGDKLKAALEEKEEKLRVLHTEILNSLQKITQEISAQENSAALINMAISEKNTVILSLTEKIDEITKGEAPEYLLNKISVRIKNLLDGCELALKNLQKITAQKQEAEINLAALTERFKNNEITKVKTEEALNKTVADAGFKNAREASAIFGEIENRQKYEKEIAEFEENFISVKAKLAASEERINRTPDNKYGTNLPQINSAIAEFTQEAEKVKRETEKLSKEAAVYAERITARKAARGKYLAFNEEKKNFEYEAGLLEDLANLFKGNRFAEALSYRQLKYIVFEATKRLNAITNGRYSLELKDLEFIIRDDFNGGIRRSPKTLSGGETFIVSLCLSLALSSKIQMAGSAPLEFFFLDEGFGTLDTEATETVLEALFSLRAENFSVGIITHVNEIKNRLDRKLNILPPVQGFRGSKAVHE
ncbi:MAG: SMC family ATPase [Clostridiales bacterium]|jgi:exonuclease SbcC|nr:SMC family ATPase [Clostridiales bacterium]